MLSQRWASGRARHLALDRIEQELRLGDSGGGGDPATVVRKSERIHGIDRTMASRLCSRRPSDQSTSSPKSLPESTIARPARAP